MTDVAGREIKVGARAVLVSGTPKDFIPRGSIGDVRDIRGGQLRLTEGPDNRPRWSMWCRPEEIAVLPTPPAGGAGGEVGT